MTVWLDEWYTVRGDTPEDENTAQARVLEAWPDAPLINLDVCDMILQTAQEQVIAYAPDPGTVEAALVALLAAHSLDAYTEDVLTLLDLDNPWVKPPRRLVYAQRQQARNLWDAGRVATDGNVGIEGYTFTPRPLDKTVRQIIRPVDGKPHVL